MISARRLFKERSRFPEEVTVSRISSETVEIISKISISMGEKFPLDIPCALEVLRGRSLSNGNMLKTLGKMKDFS